MILVRIRERFHIRQAEWIAGASMIAIGLYLIVWPMAFHRAGLTGFASLASREVWIAACTALGVARIAALILNGHNPRLSAPVRCLGAILGVGIFSSIAAGYSLATNAIGPPMAMLLAGALALSDLFSAARSGIDTMHALEGKAWIGSTP